MLLLSGVLLAARCCAVVIAQGRIEKKRKKVTELTFVCHLSTLQKMDADLEKNKKTADWANKYRHVSVGPPPTVPPSNALGELARGACSGSLFYRYFISTQDRLMTKEELPDYLLNSEQLVCALLFSLGRVGRGVLYPLPSDGLTTAFPPSPLQISAARHQGGCQCRGGSWPRQPREKRCVLHGRADGERISSRC